ncbi:hypothetical protein [Hymenobacter properus]|uniref:DUF4377 domain-containing protein n=1 Tax=Hymenobacter properus TaxID=2791026 RepID=A0A931BGR3_9BACT|nr:hypothetical protein [Hymenobacter properus]MBF9143645.1 hypothetical protein [Hymenobacter properus]MBR7722458.1 hypothetical protein [Microvirga sp. SRT04]
MRLFPLFPVAVLAAAGLLTGCTAKTDIAPEAPCGTYATVRLCYGMTAVCATEHTTLELADGTRLHPTGPLWAAYQPHQAEGQVLHIGYSQTNPPTDAAGSARANITCLEEGLPRCPPMAHDGN